MQAGTPGDGMSVPWNTVKVENIIDVKISQSAGHYVIEVVQTAPPANSDAIGFDRILLVTFDGPVSADDVEASIGER